MSYENFQSAIKRYNSRFTKPDRGEDPGRIIEIIKNKFNVVLTKDDAIFLWEWWSEEHYCASWLSIHYEAEVEEAFDTFIKEYGDKDETID